MKRIGRAAILLVLLCVAGWANYRAFVDRIGERRLDETSNNTESPALADHTTRVMAKSAQVSNGDLLLQTTRLPIQMHTDFVAGTVPIAVGAGAIDIINGRVVIMDRLGAFFLWDGQKAMPIKWPSLPNNVKEFESYWKERASIDDLRTHDLAFDIETGMLFASFEAFDEDSHGLRLQIARIGLDPKTMRTKGDWTVLFRGNVVASGKGAGGVSAGGKLLIAKHTLYFSAGDYVLSDLKNPKSGDPPPAQNPNLTFGKTYSMPVAGSIPQMFTMGHRNPQGLGVRSDGTILETEHGPRGGDKLNVLELGKNYGWPYLSEGSRYGTYDPVASDPKQDANYQDALFNFVPSIAPTAVTEVHNFDKAWDTDIIICSLKARSIIRLRIKNGAVVLAEPIWIGYRIRDIASQPGRLILWTDDGSLVTLTVARAQLASKQLTDTWITKSADFAGNCASCHEGQGATAVAPPLDDVFGRPIGGAQYNKYTKSLQNRPGVWDDNTLFAYIKYPSQFAPGTAMPDTDMPDQRIRDIIGVLKKNAQYGATPSLSRGLVVAQ